MIGKVSVARGNPNPTSGIPRIDIVHAEKRDSIFVDLAKLSSTSFDSEYLSNNGFFDIRVNVGKKKSIFFLNPVFFVEEFKVEDLITNEVK